MEFAINHITVPGKGLEAFFDLAKSIGLDRVEIRNDMPDVVANHTPGDVRSAAEMAGVKIITINALYPFNCWSAELESKANRLADYALACGVEAIVMCPLNEGRAVPDADLALSLKNLKPILKARQLVGLVEPLGFVRSSLRTKRAAVNAIDEVGGWDTFRLVHDTFHHHLASESELFPARTGLVHISGVTDPAIAIDDLSDDDRVLVDDRDRLDNIAQMRALIEGGYKGLISLEAFSPSVHALTEPGPAVKKSLDYVRYFVTG